MPSYRELEQPGGETCCRETIWISQNQLLGGPEYGQAIADAIHKVLENADELRISLLPSGKLPEEI